MQFRFEQFQQQPEHQLYVAEASELGIAPGCFTPVVSINGCEFQYSSTDFDYSGEDVAGWRYKPTIDAVKRRMSLVGWHVLIIND